MKKEGDDEGRDQTIQKLIPKRTSFLNNISHQSFNHNSEKIDAAIREGATKIHRLRENVVVFNYLFFCKNEHRESTSTIFTPGITLECWYSCWKTCEKITDETNLIHELHLEENNGGINLQTTNRVKKKCDQTLVIAHLA